MAHAVVYPHASSRARSSSTLSSWSSTIRIRASCSRTIARPEKALHLGDDRARLAWLREIPVAADLHCFLPVGCQRVRGERNDRNLLRRRILLQDLGGFPP